MSAIAIVLVVVALVAGLAAGAAFVTWRILDAWEKRDR